LQERAGSWGALCGVLLDKFVTVGYVCERESAREQGVAARLGERESQGEIKREYETERRRER